MTRTKVCCAILILGLLMGCETCFPQPKEPAPAKPAPTPKAQPKPELRPESVLVEAYDGDWTLTLEEVDARINQLLIKVKFEDLSPIDQFQQRIQTRNVMMLRELQRRAVEELGIEVPEEEVRKRVNSQLRAAGFDPEDPQLREKLAARDVDLDEVYAEQRGALQIEAWYEQMVPVAPPSEEELRKHYKERHHEERLAREILVRIPHIAPQDQVKRARAEIERIHQLVTAPDARFRKIAEQESDSPTAWSGGMMEEWIRFGNHEFAVEDAAFALEKGEVSPPFRTQNGFMILKLVDIKPVEAPPFDEVRDAMANYIRLYRRQQKLMEIERRLIAEADVRFPVPLEDYIPVQETQ